MTVQVPDEIAQKHLGASEILERQIISKEYFINKRLLVLSLIGMGVTTYKLKSIKNYAVISFFAASLYFHWKANSLKKNSNTNFGWDKQEFIDFAWYYRTMKEVSLNKH